MQRQITWLYYEIDILRQILRPPAASTRLLEVTIDRNHLEMAEMNSVTQKTKMTYHEGSRYLKNESTNPHGPLSNGAFGGLKRPAARNGFSDPYIKTYRMAMLRK